METMNEKKGIKRFTSVIWWVITAIIILSLACSLGPVSLTWNEPEPESETTRESEAPDTEVPLEEEAALVVPTETPTQEAAPMVPTEVHTEEEAIATTAPITGEEVADEPVPIPHAIPVGSDYQLMFVYRGQIYWLDLNTLELHPFWEGVGVFSAWLNPDQDYLLYYPREYETSTPPVVFHHLQTGQEILFSEDRGSTALDLDKKTITYSIPIEDDGFSGSGGAGLNIFYLETGETETLIEDDDFFFYFGGSWSPDGERMIFGKGPRESSGFAAYVFDRQTQETTELACKGCRWSPDGRFIAGVDVEFYYRVDGPLYLIDVARGETWVLYEREGFTADRPRWSPDGNWIAFSLYTVDDDLFMEEYIYNRQDIPFIIDRQGQNLLEIPVMEGQPILWSPDSSQVLLRVDHERLERGEGVSLYLYDLNENEAYLLFEFEDSWAGSFQFIEACALGCD